MTSIWRNSNKYFRSAPSEAQKKRDAERKARLAEMRAKTLAAKKAAEKAGAEDTTIIIS